MTTRHQQTDVHESITKQDRNNISPPVKKIADRSKAVLLCGFFYVFPVFCLLCLFARLFICALWSPAGKGLTSWTLFVVLKPQLHCHDFGHDGATTHPDLSSRDASA